MTTLDPHIHTQPPDGTVAEAQDRRRPGRADQVSQALVPLLRQSLPEGADREALLDVPADDACFTDADFAEGDDDGPHDLAAARGIGIGLLMAIPLWMIARAAVLLVLR